MNSSRIFFLLILHLIELVFSSNNNLLRTDNYVPYAEIKNRMEIFPGNSQDEIVYTKNRLESEKFKSNLNDITDYKEILIDSKNELIFVGAKNYLIKLSYKNDKFEVKDLNNDILKWTPGDDLENECKRVSKEKYCHNFVKVLAHDSRPSDSDCLFVCSTNASKPTCTWRKKDNLSQILEITEGIGKIPKTPDLSSLYTRMSNGDFFFASSIDYGDISYQDYLIHRDIGPSKKVRTDPYNSNWLNNPVFVGSVSIGDYVYFFIRETAIEYKNCGEKIYSRVIRICKQDQGIGNSDILSTFEKARINCSIPGGYSTSQNPEDYNIYNSFYSEQRYPFYFDEIQDVFYDDRKNLIYAIFTTPMNGMKGSAICIYDVKSLENAFNGPFKHQKSQNSVWEPYDEEIEMPKCGSGGKSKFIDSQKFQLKHLSVQPIYDKPIIVLQNKRLVKIAVDNVLTKHENDVDILFAATEYNTIMKYTILNSEIKSKVSPNVCLLEEIEIFDRTRKDMLNSINNLVLLETTKFTNRLNRNLIVATKFNLLKIQVSNCESQTNFHGCLSALDPYCIWDSKVQKCLFIFNTNETTSNQENSIYQNIKLNGRFHQHLINICPSTSLPVDGGFSEWSTWSTCLTKSGDKCKCRMRMCNNPEPRNGGKSCDENSLIEILNCEINGGWTEWSSWSACKLSSPANCEHNTQLNTPPAIRTRTRSCSNPEPKNGGRLCVGLDKEEEICSQEMINPCISSNSNQWSNWGAWEECSKTCGEGFQMRRRVCNGKNCVGCNQEWKLCNSNPCPEKSENILTDWDLVETNKESNQKLEKRFRISCKYDNDLETNNLDGMDINATAEYRVCEHESDCRSLSSINDLGDWTEWSKWSKCSDCGDQQYRSRKCSILNGCFGHDREIRDCTCENKLSWSCWSDFTSCSAKCGKGFHKRTRICLLNSQDCEGVSEEIVPCLGTNCTDGTLNDKIFQQVSSFSIQNMDNISFSLSHLIVSCVIMFLLGSLLVLVIIYINLKTKNKLCKRLCCCCSCSSSKKKSINNQHQLSTSLDHNSMGTDTAATTETNDNPKFCSSGSDSSSNSASSSHSKEYFTIGNRFDPTGISSLLNDVIPDDDDDDMINVGLTSGTLNRNKCSNKMSNFSKHNTLGLPNKSFNTYINHKDLSKNSSANSSGLSANVNSTHSNSATSSGTLRFSNFSNLNINGSVRSSKNQRTSFAFPMRTNLDQEL